MIVLFSVDKDFPIKLNTKCQPKTFWGYDCIEQFCKWLFQPKNEKLIVIGHNGGKFDHHFIANYMIIFMVSFIIS